MLFYLTHFPHLHKKATEAASFSGAVGPHIYLDVLFTSFQATSFMDRFDLSIESRFSTEPCFDDSPFGELSKHDKASVGYISL